MPPKKTTPKKAAPKKIVPPKITEEPKETLKEEIKPLPPAVTTPLINPNPTCKCMQKRTGKFYCFKLQGGRWVQASGIPFETKEECEEASCEE